MSNLMTVKPVVDFSVPMDKSRDSYSTKAKVMELEEAVYFSRTYVSAQEQKTQIHSEIDVICGKLGIEVDWTEAIATYEGMIMERDARVKEERRVLKEKEWEKKYVAVLQQVQSLVDAKVVFELSPTKEEYLEDPHFCNLSFRVKIVHKENEIVIRQNYRSTSRYDSTEIFAGWMVYTKSSRGSRHDITYKTITKAYEKAKSDLDAEIEAEISKKKSAATFKSTQQLLANALGLPVEEASEWHSSGRQGQGYSTTHHVVKFNAIPTESKYWSDSEVKFDVLLKKDMPREPKNMVFTIVGVKLESLTFEELQQIISIAKAVCERKCLYNEKQKAEFAKNSADSAKTV